MSSFSAEWLSLREPADAAARSARLIEVVAARFQRAAVPSVLDLGAGTGSNFRAMAERLADRQSWLLVDHDTALLGQSLAKITSWGRARGYAVHTDRHGVILERECRTLHVAARSVDLALIDDEKALVPQGGLVTASALLDLVSETWLRRVADLCRRRGALVLFALTYDGRFRCSPVEPEDCEVQELVNQHQRRDKGLGAALGPAALDSAERCFVGRGYKVQRETSDWILPPEAEALQRALIEGWAEAAAETASDRVAFIQAWQDRRLAHVAGGRSQLIVGHQDLAGWIGEP